ncbi:hypothetical protein HLH33_18700 [Gluconacetobacter diazotrophicus]|uniref:Uncharacterized protein n=1 Tax=Gluconacetobacter diazotrophicus TaxID=33996 RepID=A0A7W4NPM8_GLUDI|nr:hypothetical protein [Gluconacetobacter diazotrophicus]MBB2158295.1 hypothetical protein [Gluconacetobacter diazotrophicus]
MIDKQTTAKKLKKSAAMAALRRQDEEELDAAYCSQSAGILAATSSAGAKREIRKRINT